MQNATTNSSRKPEVDTTSYQFSHGHAPKGRGGWAFALTRNPKPDEIYWAKVQIPGTDAFTSSLTYSEAKREAQKHFAGHASIVVLS